MVCPLWIHRKVLGAGRVAGKLDRPEPHAEQEQQFAGAADDKTLSICFKPPAAPLNSLFYAICFVERQLARLIPWDSLPGGSLFFAARVKSSDMPVEELPTGISGGRQ